MADRCIDEVVKLSSNSERAEQWHDAGATWITVTNYTVITIGIPLITGVLEKLPTLEILIMLIWLQWSRAS